MAKEKKGLNPADSYRREQKKLQFKKNRIEKQKVKEVRELLNDPKKIQEQIQKLQEESDKNKLDKSIKDRIKELREMEAIALRKFKMENKQLDSDNVNSSTKIVNSAFNSVNTSGNSVLNSNENTSNRPIITANPTEVNEQIERRIEDSVYYHPVFNPLAIPPPNQPQLYKPLIKHNPPVPPPPPNKPNMIPIGGMNGIPLPPPRPMAYPINMIHQPSFPFNGNQQMNFPPLPFQPLPMQQNMNQNQRITIVDQQSSLQKQRPVHRSIGSIDPLDPSGKDYADKGPAVLPKRNLKLEALEHHAVTTANANMSQQSNTISSSVLNEASNEKETKIDFHVQANVPPVETFSYPVIKESKGLSMLGDYGDSDEDDNDNNNISNINMPTIGSVSLAVAKVQELGPKIIRPDKALTQFVPASVRNKKDSMNTVKRTIKTNNPVVENNTNTLISNSNPSSNHKSSAVDDAYQRFLEEIESLGAIS